MSNASIYHVARRVMTSVIRHHKKDDVTAVDRCHAVVAAPLSPSIT